MLLGAHVGITQGLAEASHEGRRIGCDAIQIFSKSPQMWEGPPIAPEAAAAFRESLRVDRIRATAVHHGYLLNLATPKRPMLRRSRRAFLDEVRRAELLGVDALIFHPGAHIGSGIDAGLALIAESLLETLRAVPEGKVRLVLENAAGQGTTLGSTFEQLERVLATVNAPGRIGVALDTCHLFASGIDFRTDDAYGRMIDEIDRTFGRAAVRAFHLNDAQAPLGSHRDRHENIGKGAIGLDGFRHIVNDAAWTEIPGYLETPLDGRDYERYAEDLHTLRSLLPSGQGEAPIAERPRRSLRRSSTVK